MTEYRTDRRKLEQRQNLERLADEAAELEQVAQDIDLCSKAQEAGVRLRTKGLNLIEREDCEDARKYVNELLQKAKAAVLDKKEKRKQLYQKLGKIGKIAAISAAALAVIGAPIYAIAHYWNSRDEALQALAKYDKPVKITDPKEREEVVSQLDEIFEEHAIDSGSDEAAKNYLAYLVGRGYTINQGAITLDAIGKNVVINHNALLLENSVYQYDFFLKAKNISLQKGQCLLQILKEEATSDNLIPTLEKLYNIGFCK